MYCREGRRLLIQLHTQEAYNSLSSEEWEELVIKTEGYSGSDISTVISDALLEPVRELESAQYWKPVQGEITIIVTESDKTDLMTFLHLYTQ